MATEKTTKSKRPRKPVVSGAVARPVTDHGTPVAVANGSRTVEKIQRRAYELFLARGGGHSNDWIDWFTAEKELIGSQCRKSPPPKGISPSRSHAFRFLSLFCSPQPGLPR